MQRLLTIPGIGLLTATAIVGFVGDLRRFPSGRRFSSYLGLVPKENSSGDIRRLGRITKRGDSYLRTLLHAGRTRRAPSGQRQQEPARQAPRLALCANIAETLRPLIFRKIKISFLMRARASATVVQGGDLTPL